MRHKLGPYFVFRPFWHKGGAFLSLLTFDISLLRTWKRGLIEGNMSDSVTNYKYFGNTKISVSIKKNNANKCILSFFYSPLLF